MTIGRTPGASERGASPGRSSAAHAGEDGADPVPSGAAGARRGLRCARETAGVALLVSGLVVLYHGVAQLRVRDYLACCVLLLSGLSLVKASVELLRPSIGE